MNTRRTLTVLLTSVAVLATAGAVRAQTSTLYITDGDNNFIKAIRGGLIVDQNKAIGGGRRYRIVVRDTIWLGDMDPGTNAEFDLSLFPTGNTSPTGVDITEGADGATDGVFNYTVESFRSTGDVYRFDSDWSGGTRLFTVTGDGINGITYDTSDDALWVADQFVISQYDMAGNVLSSFCHAGDRGSLAYEPVTDTLWFVTRSGGRFIHQYSKDGEWLQTLEVPFGGNVLGAEFGSILCPADLDGDGKIGFSDLLTVLAAWGNKGGPEDLDGSGFVDIGDILAVLSSWGPCE